MSSLNKPDDFDDDFYVEDEPIEDVLARYKAGIKIVSRPPIPPPNPLLQVTSDDSPAIPLN